MNCIFFLMKKDRDFFDNVCIKHIQAKLNKDFMDHYFLNNTNHLIQYTQLTHFQSLNPMEQILLAQSLDVGEYKRFRTRILKQYSSLYDSFEYDQTLIRKYISAALVSSKSQVAEEKRQTKSGYSAYMHKNVHPTRDPINDPTMEPTTYPTLEPTLDPTSDTTTEPTNAPTSKPTNLPSPAPTMARTSFHRKRAEMRSKKLFEQIEKTTEYQETYYWNTRWKLDIINNKFWSQYAIYLLDDKITSTDFLSKWFPFAQSSTNEILLAMAVMDLPLNTDNKQPRNNQISYIYNDKKSINHNVTIKSETPTLLFIKQLKQANTEITNAKSDPNQEQSILVHTNYFDPKQKYIQNEQNEKIEKFIDPLDMRPIKVYGMSIVITVISSVSQPINILKQIPTGSIALNDGYETRVDFITMQPYTVKKFEIYFYFPSIGTFQQYPIIVYKSDSGIIASSSPSKQFNHKVIVKYGDKSKPKITNIESWNQVSLYGNDQEIYQYLSTHNLYTTDLSRMYYKLKQSKELFDNVLKLCVDQNYFDDTIWSFHFYYTKQEIDDLSREALKLEIKQMRQYLLKWHTSNYQHANDIRFIDNHNVLPSAARFRKEDSYIYLEYIPLINARAHLLGQQRKLLNAEFNIQYAEFLKHLLLRSKSILDLSLTDLISASYYLLLQDRFDEANDIYKIIKYHHKNDLKHLNSFLFDYFTVYMSLYEQDVTHRKQHISNTIQKVLSKYKDITLIKSKGKLFNEMRELLSDINNEQDNIIKDDPMTKHEQKTKNYQNFQEYLDFDINKEERCLVIKSQNVNKYEISFYVINMEILFSMDPSLILKQNQIDTVNDKHSIFSYIQPNSTIDINVDKDELESFKSNVVSIPTNLKNENLFISITSPTLTVSKPYLDHPLIVQIRQNYGKLKVLTMNQSDSKLTYLSGTYIKVFALIGNEYEFYKDGYTDIRGEFDYVSISTDQLENTKKFAIFVSNDEYGSFVTEADVPKR